MPSNTPPTMGRQKQSLRKHKLNKDPGVFKLTDLKLRRATKERLWVPTLSDPSLKPDASESTMSSLDLSQLPEISAQRTKEQLRRHHVRALHKVIDESDIIILVLDARDPEGCRSRLVEEQVRRRESEGKKLVFVLNKIDLVPRENAQAWLRYLRHSTPTLPFRSVASHQRSNLSSATAPALLRLLKAYKPTAAHSVTVGVVGFPNVGKSSLINSLKRSKACAVAAQPGHTKDLQTVQLERGLKIIDSPGVVFDEEEHDDAFGQRQKGSVLLRNVVKVEDIADPIAVVEEILLRTERATIQKIYGLPDFSNALEFLTMLALSSGKLLKGGTPDVLSAARHVLVDWNHQKIPYVSVPPTIHPSMIPSTISSGAGGPTIIAPGAETVGQAHIRSELSKPFELAGLFGAADARAFSSDEVAASLEVPMDDDAGDHEEMVAEDTPFHLPLKRSHSVSLETEPVRALQGAVSGGTQPESTRMPKRMRKAKDLSVYEVAAAESHPLRRKALKTDAKRARRAVSQLQRRNMGLGTGMDVDVEMEMEMEMETGDGAHDLSIVDGVQ